MTPAELLRAGRWSRREGMQTLAGARLDDPPVTVVATIASMLPDPSDDATRLLMLSDLARRVGLDPAWGVAWQPNRDADGRILGWVLSRGLFSSEFHGFVADGVPVGAFGASHPARFTHVPAIDTTDPTLALLLAGVATAGGER